MEKKQPKKPTIFRQKMHTLRQKRIARLWLLLFFYLYLLDCEAVVRLQSAQFFWSEGILPILCYSGAFALLFYALCSLFSPRINRIVELTLTWGLFLFYAAQFIYNYKFHFFFSAYSMGNGGQILEFWQIILHAIVVKFLYLLAMLLPALFMSVLGCWFREERTGRRPLRLLLVPLALLGQLLINWSLPLYGTGPMSPYDLYHDTNDLSKGAYQLGLATAFRLDVQRLIFGFHGGELEEEEIPEELSEEWSEELSEETEEPTKEPLLPIDTAVATEPEELDGPEEPEYNILPIDFDAYLAEETDETIAELHRYFRDQPPSEKNEKTGLFAGCNLIQITAEGFSHLAIDPELTPTLYRLQTEGMQFPDFYTAYWGVSTSDGEYVNLTGTIPKSGAWSMQESAANAMPLTMAQQLKRLGYSAYAYHNHDYDYYHREQSHPNLGYIYRALGNGLPITEQWPESDVEMIDVSTADYVGKEPFHVYYMTVSGHLEYVFDEGKNAMACKNRPLVEHLPYSEAVQAYLACQIELDRAVELLLTRLEEAGVLENTVIVLSADHYPYGLTLEEMGELAGHEIDPQYEIYRNACIIYKSGMTPEVIERPCSSLDLLPTLSNLFGLDYDSRLYMGQDIFSAEPPMVLFCDRSWLTDFGAYATLTETYSSYDGEAADPEIIEYYNDVVANRFLVSQWVLETDYWRILFGDNLPPDDLAPQLPHKPDSEPPDDLIIKE